MNARTLNFYQRRGPARKGGTINVFSELVRSRKTPMKLEHPLATGCGLAIALLALPACAAGYRLLTGQAHSNLQPAVRDITMLFTVVILLWLVRNRESLPLSSIGLHTERLGRSVLRGCMLALMSLLVTVGLYLLMRRLGVQLGEEARGTFRPSLWIVTLGMFRAGIAEETFYRGYAIERLQSLSGSIWLAGLVPLVIFAAAHYPQGWGGIVAVFVVGGVATVFYLKFRDLIANIIGHTVVDLILNVGLPLVSGG